MNTDAIRHHFPILEREVYNRPLVYLDNAASSQTPRCVVEAIERMYYTYKSNVHRGVHRLSQESTAAVEASRARVAEWIGASETAEIIFTRGTTEAINLVASSMGWGMNEGDEVILTVMEHHANIVPWQLLAMHRGIKIRVVPIDATGCLDLDVYQSLFGNRTRMVAFCHVSNVLGTVNPVHRMIQIAHSHGVPVLVDGAQAVPHMRVDVGALDADFYAFSSHKMYGPTGIGVLYGKRALLEQMPPYQGGGEMISHVSFEGTTWADLPFKFEAGTPDYVDIVGLHAAIDFIDSVGIDHIHQHEQHLLHYATERMMLLPGMRIFGTAPDKSAVISFVMGGEHPYDTGMLLDKQGIAVRTGHHCAQPLMHALGVEGTVRASFAMYNTEAEVDALVAALQRIADILGL